MTTRSVTLAKRGKSFKVLVGTSKVPLWDAGTLDFALMCAESFLSGKNIAELAGRPILEIDPKTFRRAA